MAWFAAHCVSIVRFDDEEEQDSFPVEENVLLVEADSVEMAQAKAQALGAENYDGDEVDWDGRQGTYVFVGVRKLVECEDAATVARPAPPPGTRWTPGDGTELTYSYFEIDGEEELSELMAGESVVLSLDE